MPKNKLKYMQNVKQVLQISTVMFPLRIRHLRFKFHSVLQETTVCTKLFPNFFIYVKHFHL